jgi:acyl carrier protein
MNPTAETNPTARLGACFSKVFPNLTEAERFAASAEGLPQWDSLATLNLIALIEEEFEVSIDPDDFEEPPSFQSFLQQIQSSAGGR